MHRFFTHRRFVITIGLVALLSSTACRKKTGAAPAENLEAEAAKFTAAEAAPPQPAAPGAPAAPAPAPAQEMQSAVQAYKVGEFEEAVTRMQKLRNTPGISGAQLMAINNALTTMMADIQNLANKGDQRAIAAIKRYEKIQTEGVR